MTTPRTLAMTAVLLLLAGIHGPGQAVAMAHKMATNEQVGPAVGSMMDCPRATSAQVASLDARLEEMLGAVGATDGDERIEALAALVGELVGQQRLRYRQIECGRCQCATGGPAEAKQEGTLVDPLRQYREY